MSSDTGSVPALGGSEVVTRLGESSGGGDAITFDISMKSLIIRLIKNKIFGILTFGIYRFWGKTYVRQLLWQGVRVGDDRLEYRGTAKELFLGFLIAMIILVPILLVSSLVIEILSVMSANPFVNVVGQIAYFALLYSFWQFARYRLWRYRLSRTAWKGIRFFLAGSAIRYALNVLLRSFVAAITLGWAYPWLQSYRLNYQLNNTQFGNGQFTYSGSTRDLYRIYWPAILIAQIVAAGAVAVLVNSGAMQLTEEMLTVAESGRMKIEDEIMPVFMGVGVVLFLNMAIFSFVTRIWEFRYLVGKTRFKEARFTSRLSVRSVLMIFLIMIALTIISLLVLGGFFTVIVFWQNGAAMTLFFVLLFVMLIGMDILYVLFLLVPIVKKICDTTDIENLHVFEETAASSAKSPKYGEGFADAMDVGAF